MSRRNARLTFHGRLLLVERIANGQPVSHAAKAVRRSLGSEYHVAAAFDPERREM
jgi:hypothetical protein